MRVSVKLYAQDLLLRGLFWDGLLRCPYTFTRRQITTTRLMSQVEVMRVSVKLYAQDLLLRGLFWDRLLRCPYTFTFLIVSDFFSKIVVPLLVSCLLTVEEDNECMWYDLDRCWAGAKYSKHATCGCTSNVGCQAEA